MPAPYEDTLGFGLEEVRKDMQLLLDKEVRLAPPTTEWIPEDATNARLPLDIEMVIEAEEAGKIRLRFDSRVGILMSGLLKMVDEDDIRERLKTGKLVAEDAEAIAEIGSQFAGSLNTGLTAARDEAAFHVRRGTVWLDGKPGPRLESGPVLRVVQPFSIADFPACELQLTFDAVGARASLGAGPAGIDATTAGTTAAEPVATAPPRRRPPPPAIEAPRVESSLLLLYETRQAGWETAEIIRRTTGWPIVIQRLDSTARHRLLAGGTSVVVVDTGVRKERGLTACRRLVHLINGAGIPVYMCAPDWHREEVQRAVRAGVSGILVKPLDPEHVEGCISGYALAT